MIRDLLPCAPSTVPIDGHRAVLRSAAPDGEGAGMHPNGELIREALKAFAKGDMDTISRVFDDASSGIPQARAPSAATIGAERQSSGTSGK